MSNAYEKDWNLAFFGKRGAWWSERLYQVARALSLLFLIRATYSTTENCSVYSGQHSG